MIVILNFKLFEVLLYFYYRIVAFWQTIYIDDFKEFFNLIFIRNIINQLSLLYSNQALALELD